MPRCDVCCIDFKTNTNYRRHLLTQRHIQCSAEDVKKYVCLCGRKYQYPQSLYGHRRDCSVYQNRDQSVSQPVQTPNTEISQLQSKINHIETELKTHIENTEKLFLDMTNLFKEHHTIVNQGRRKINKTVRQEIINSQNNKCNECHNELSPYYQIDHVIALQFGGTDERNNLVALCCECHAKKSAIENQCKQKIRDYIAEVVTTVV
jgi:5-methylcytosine-specific restriction endonuclease McrA